MTNWWHFSYFSQKIWFAHQAICMKCQCLIPVKKIRKIFHNTAEIFTQHAKCSADWLRSNCSLYKITKYEEWKWKQQRSWPNCMDVQTGLDFCLPRSSPFKLSCTFLHSYAHIVCEKCMPRTNHTLIARLISKYVLWELIRSASESIHNICFHWS